MNAQPLNDFDAPERAGLDPLATERIIRDGERLWRAENDGLMQQAQEG